MSRAIALLLVLIIVEPAQAEVYQAPDREPTPAETLILEMMNRFRADPHGAIPRMAPETGPRKVARWIKVDWDMFRTEIRALEPSPPLVFNLSLLDSARKHSFYMIHNGLGHDEIQGRRGFTGASPGERMKAAGYSGGGGENAFRDARDAWNSHSGFVIDHGPGGTGGMQPGRGHRRNMMNTRFREVGPSAVPHSGRISVVHNFGARRSGRLVGGVMYFDKNNNDFYDIGEGIGGVEVSGSDGSKTRSWSSGAYALELKSSDPGKVTITGTFSGITHSQVFQSGKDNLKFDWIVPQQAMLEKTDELLASVAKVRRPGSSQHRKALVALHLGTVGFDLDKPRREKLEALVGDIRREISGSQLSVRDALAAKPFDMNAFARAVRDGKKKFRGTALATWFSEAEVFGSARSRVENYTGLSRPPQHVRMQLTKWLERATSQVTIGEFRSPMDKLLAEVKPRRKERRRYR